MSGAAASLLRELLDRGLQLRTDGEALTLRAPRGGWTDELRAAAAARKHELIALLAPGCKHAPAAPAQEDLWLLDRRTPGGTAYDMPEALRLSGAADAACLAASLGEIVRRHEALRTTFALVAGRPCQVVAPPAAPALAVIDLSGLGPARREAEARRLAVAEARRPFDLERGPLLRAALICLAGPPRRPRDSVLLRNVHHAVFDGVSAAIFERELARLYAAALAGRPSPLAAPPLQYADFAARERLALADERTGETIEAAPLELPADRPRAGSRPRRGALHLRSLDDVAGKLAVPGASRFMAALAAFAATLGRVAGRRHVVVGTTADGRDKPELEGLIGFFVRTPALRVLLAGEPTLAALVGQVRDAVLEALARPPAAGALPPFHVVFQLHVAGRPAELPGLAVEPFELPVPPAKFDLVVNLHESPGALSSTWHFNPELFDSTTIRRLAARFAAVLGADPATTVPELPLLAAAERHQLLREWNDGPMPAAPETTLDALFRRQAAARPDAVAATFGGRHLSYGELARRAGALALRLRSLGAGRGSRVALWVERSLDTVVAVAGTLAAGAAYVPVDPSAPPARTAFTLDDARAAVLVTTPRLAGRLPPGAAARLAGLVLLDDEDAGSCPPPTATPDDPAYVIYTSGSTGRPKGVVVTHACVARLLAAAGELFRFGPADVWTLFHSYAFDFSVWEIWGALAHGGRLVVVPQRTARAPDDFRALVGRQRVTVLSQTPSAFRLFMTAAGDPAEGDVRALRYVVFGGEALAPASLRPWIERHGADRPELIDMYGITETTVHVTYRRLTRAGASGIGRPLPGRRLHVTDERLRPAPIGSPGELAVGGGGVSVGYLDRPALTAARFVPDPWGEPGGRLYRSGDRGRQLADGELRYLGRLDHQVQIRGHRVEPGEVEACLARHPRLSAAAVVPRERGGETVLVAYVVAAGERAPGLAEIRGFLSAELPEPMLPSAVVALERLPLTVNGKVDRAALPEPPGARPELTTDYAAPATALERFLAALWAEVLELDRVGSGDDFFELGGTSIRGAVLINRLQRRLGEILHVVTIFDHPTVAALAAYLREQHPQALARLGLIVADDAPRAGHRRVVERDVERFVASVPPRAAAPRLLTQNPPAVFVLAPPRSGSTLLRVMLAGHPRLFAPPELELLSFDSMAERDAVFSGRLSFWREGLVRAVMAARGLDAGEAERAVAALAARDAPTREVYRWLQQALGERLLVDKTPSYALDGAALERAEAWFDGPRYLHLVRHPCGVVHSFVEARLDEVLWRPAPEHERRELAELLWLASHRNVLRFLAGVPPERAHRVLYEDLVRRPREVMAGVCRFLGLDFDDATTRPYDGAPRRMTDGPRAESRPLGDVKLLAHPGVDAAAADRWRGRLSPESLGEPTRALAAELGYEPAVGKLTPIPRRPGPRDEAPLSFAQQRLWFLHQLDPASAAYNLPAAFELAGRLDVAALRRAFREIVRRHETLRTTFPGRGGRGRQAIAPAADVALPLVDLRNLPAARREEATRRTLRLEARRPFDLERGPVLRLALLRTGVDRHVLAVAVHHIVSDGWSQGVLRREIGVLYGAVARGESSPLAEPPIRYGDFAAWQQRELAGEALAGELAWWRARLAGAVPLELPADRPRPAVWRDAGAAHDFELSAGTSTALLRLSEGLGASLFMTLLAGFAALLARVTGRYDVAVGSPVAGRNRPELEGLIGLFVNMSVLRLDVSGDPPFRELLARARRVSLDAYSHPDLPFEKLVDELAPARDASRTPLVQVVLALAEAGDALEMPGLAARELGIEAERARFDLEVFFKLEDARLAGGVVYAAALFDATTMARLARRLATLLQGAVDDPGRRLAELPLLSAGERQQLDREWSVGADAPAGEDLVHELLAARAARTPEAVAAVDGGAHLSFRELDRRAARRCRELRRAGVGPEAVVGLVAERSLAGVAGVLGVLRAGGAYLPLDPRDGAERHAELLTQVRAAVPRPSGPVRPENPAYVLFTSGSTGRPKGVVVSHRSLARYLRWLAGSFPPPPGGVPWHTSLTFDLTVPSFYVPLLADGPLVVVPESRGTEGLEDVLERSLAGLLKVTPTHLALLRDALAGVVGAGVLIAGGEPLDGGRAAPWRRRFPGSRIVNSYGPAETTVACAAYELPPGTVGAGPLPIGRPIAGARLHLVDRRLRTVPLGAPGELCVAGPGLARGYLAQPAATAAVFVPDPLAGAPGGRLYRTGDLARHRADGLLTFLGRRDQQLKVRGVRVEPGEVEAALRRHRAVRDAAVVARGDAEQRRLVAYVAGRDASPSLAAELDARLRRRLAHWAVPSAIVVLDALPLLPGGKVDRAALAGPGYEPARPRPREGRRARPRAGAEARLARIWSDVLGVAEVAGDDDFFALGGDSLLTLQVVAQAREAGLPLRVHDLFRYPVLSRLAETAERRRPAPSPRPSPAAGPLPLTPVQSWFFELDVAEPWHFNLSLLLTARRPLDPGRLRRALARLVAHHEALRLRFARGDGGWSQSVTPPGNVAFLWLDLSRVGACRKSFERCAGELQRACDLSSGPLLRAAWVDQGRLLLVVHHLAVDAVSWRILLEDLERAYRGDPLTPVPTPFSDWARRLPEAARAVEHRLDAWREPAPPLPQDGDGPNTVASAARVEVVLGRAATRRLLDGVPAGHRADELLLAAVVRAFAVRSGQPRLHVHLEGHGRAEHAAGGVDLSRTVGWFTTIAPVVLADAGDGPATLAAVHETVSALRGRGLDYGLLRYASGDAEIALLLAAQPRPAVSFNYLGRLDAWLPSARRRGGLFAYADEPTGPDRNPRGLRPHVLEVLALILDGRLRVVWTFSRNRHRRATVERLARDFLSELRGLTAAG